MSDETYEKGKALSDRINPGMEDALMDRYEDIVPGMPRHMMQAAYGDILSRDGLDLKSRMIATIAALTVLGGGASSQLRVNMQAALRAGLTRREIGEVIWQMSLYGGVPAAINGLNTARALFAELDEDNKDA